MVIHTSLKMNQPPSSLFYNFWVSTLYLLYIYIHVYIFLSFDSFWKEQVSSHGEWILYKPHEFEIISVSLVDILQTNFTVKNTTHLHTSQVIWNFVNKTDHSVENHIFEDGREWRENPSDKILQKSNFSFQKQSHQTTFLLSPTSHIGIHNTPPALAHLVHLRQVAEQVLHVITIHPKGPLSRLLPDPTRIHPIYLQLTWSCSEEIIPQWKQSVILHS